MTSKTPGTNPRTVRNMLAELKSVGLRLDEGKKGAHRNGQAPGGAAEPGQAAGEEARRPLQHQARGDQGGSGIVKKFMMVLWENTAEEDMPWRLAHISDRDIEAPDAHCAIVRYAQQLEEEGEHAKHVER